MTATDRNEENVRILKEWYKKQPHLPQGIQDEYFVTFAYGAKSVEIAKQKIDSFFTMRRDLIWMRDFDNQMEIYLKKAGGDYFYLPGKTKEGWRVMVASFTRVDFNTIDPVQELFTRMMSIELGLVTWPHDTSVAMIYDLKDCPAWYMANLDFSGEVSTINFTLRSLPRRLKKTVIVNSSAVAEKAVNLFKPFLSKKLLDRLEVMKGCEGLTNIFPVELLPEEFGGTAGSIKDMSEKWRQEMISKETWFRKVMKLRSDETLRPKESAYKILEAGTQGSFRSLTID